MAELSFRMKLPGIHDMDVSVLVSPAASDAQVHLEEFDLAESRERTMSGENVEAISNRCM